MHDTGCDCAVCRHDEGMEGLHRQWREAVDSSGFAICAVMSERRPDRSEYAYTLGLARYGWPDLVITGHFTARQIQHIFHAAVDALANQGASDGLKEGVAHRLPVYLCSVPADAPSVRQLKPQTGPFYERYPEMRAGDRPPALAQLVFSDASGMLPEQPGHNPQLFQPLLASQRPWLSH